ncbi:MAG: RNA polymerase sigma factor [Enterococcus casseliflavus]
MYKQTKRRREIVRQYLPVTASSINWQETDDDLYEALQELPVSTSTLLIMKYAENLSLKEISFLLNRSEDSIKTALYRGRKQLKKRMEEKNHGY